MTFNPVDYDMDDFRYVGAVAISQPAANDEEFVDLTENTLRFPAEYIPSDRLNELLEAQRATYETLVEEFGADE